MMSSPPVPRWRGLVFLFMVGFALQLGACDCGGAEEAEGDADPAPTATHRYDGSVAALVEREPIAWMRLALRELDESALMPELLTMIREGEPEATNTFEDVTLLFHADGVQRPLVFSRGAFDREAVLTRLRSGRATQWGAYLLERDERFSVWVHPRGERAYALAAPTLIVTGPPSRVRAAVRRMNDLTVAGAEEPPSGEAGSWLDVPHALTLQIRFTDVVRVGLAERVGDPDARTFLEQVVRMRVGLDLPGEGDDDPARLHLVVQAADTEAAGLLALVLEQLLTPAFLRESGIEVPGPLEAMLERAEVRHIEQVAHAALPLRPDELRLLSAMLAEVLEEERRAARSQAAQE